MIGALATVLTGVLNEQEALSSMRWQVIFLYIGNLAMGKALVATGVGNLIGDALASLLGNNPSNYVIGLVFFLVPFIATQFMSKPLYYDRIGTNCIYDMCQYGNQPDWPLYFECSRCNDRALDSCSGSDNSFDDGHWRIQSAGHDQNVLASHNFHLRLGRGLDYDDLSCLIFQEYEKGYCHALYFNQNLLTISQTKLR